MWPSLDQQGPVMLCEHFIFHDAGVKFITVGKVRPDIFATFHVIPVDIRVSEKNPDLMFSRVLPIC